MSTETEFAPLREAEIEAFHRDGHVLREAMLSAGEAAALNQAADTSDRTRNVPLCCCSRADNAHFLDHPDNGHTPIAKLDGAEVIARADRPLHGERPFLRPGATA